MKPLFKNFVMIVAAVMLMSCSNNDVEKKPLTTAQPIPTQESVQENTQLPIQSALPSPEVTAEPVIEPELTESPALETLETTEIPLASEAAVPASVTITPLEIANLPDDIKNPYFDNYGSPYDKSGALSNDSKGWYFNRNKEHQPPTAQKDFDIRSFDGFYLGDISSKVVYLTFDEGYENGYSGQILDVLKEKQVPAAFFVTKTYIKDNLDLINRMDAEGHIVGNHTVKHKSSPTLTDEQMKAEITNTAEYYKEVTGNDMPTFFRPPMGEYSARTLNITKDLGYKTIFWSFAYKDWVVDEQPGADVAYKTVMNNLHNGAILLLHAVSSSNTEAMGNIIDSIREQGYEFKSLYDLPEYY